jgi:hypothetical protein
VSKVLEVSKVKQDPKARLVLREKPVLRVNKAHKDQKVIHMILSMNT